MQYSEFIKKWNDIPNDLGLTQLVCSSSMLNFGRDYDGNKVVLIFTNSEPNLSSKSNSFVLDKRKINSKWRTSIYLKNYAEESVYVVFLWDIFNSSLNHLNENELIEILSKRLKLWEKLFESRSKLLSSEVIQGIIGELVAIQEIFAKTKDIKTCIDNWRGPLGEDKDFIFLDEWYEIKTMRYGREKFQVSSLEQLDSLTEGYILLIELESSSLDLLANINLYDLVEKFRDLLKISIEASVEFERRLLLLGYYHEKEYSKQNFVIKRIRDYRVNSDFPRIERNQIRQEIINVQYSLSISGLEPYRGDIYYEY